MRRAELEMDIDWIQGKEGRKREGKKERGMQSGEVTLKKWVMG